MDMIKISQGLYNRDGFQLAINLAVKQGQFVAVLGPSGAGKSTLLNVVAGFEKLAHGRIYLDGQDHSQSPPDERPVSFVFQHNNSFEHLTARQNVGLGLSPGLRLNNVQWRSVDDALAQVGIGALSNRKPGEMSGGERQRIALARVLVRQKPVLLLDEAFAALGPGLRVEMLELVQNMQRQQNLTVLMVTHQPEDARRVADEIVFVSEGRVREPLQTDQFFLQDDAVVSAYLGEA